VSPRNSRRNGVSNSMNNLLISPGMGKIKTLKNGITDSQMPIHPGVHVISRREIENFDISRLLNVAAPGCSKIQLNDSRGKVIFAVAGYDDTEQELCEIGEVRRFFQLAHSMWPHWLYTCSTESHCLMSIALCVCPKVTTIRHGNSLAVYVGDDGLTGFFHSSLSAAAWLHSRAGISRQAGVRQLKSVARYLEISET